MEALIFMADAIAIVILVITGLKNDKLAPDQPITGLFRYADPPARPPKRRRRGAPPPQEKA